MTQQANLEQEKASRPPAIDAAPAETKDKAAPKVKSATFHFDVPFHIGPTTDLEQVERVFASMAEQRLPINLQIHFDPGSSPELIDHIAATMARHLYGDAP